MNCSMINAYTDGDVCTVRCDSWTEFGEIYVISYYADNGPDNPKNRRDNVVISKTLRKVLNKCRRESKPFILMGDINSWSQTWGMPPDRNPSSLNWWRGEVWEDIMLEYHMECLNIGNQWTYFKGDSVREEQGLEAINSIVDVCFCSAELATFVSNWMVRDASPGSDHASLEFCFHMSYPNNFQCFEEVFAYGKGDYPSYCQSMEEGCPDIFSENSLETGNYEDFSTEVSQFITLIKDCANKHIPKKFIDKRTVPDHTFGWWNSDCTQGS